MAREIHNTQHVYYYTVRHPYEQAKLAYNKVEAIIFCRLHQIAMPFTEDVDRSKSALINHLRNYHTGHNAVSGPVRDEILETLVETTQYQDWLPQEEYLDATWDRPAQSLELLPCSTAWACTLCRRTRNDYRRMVTHVREHGDDRAKVQEVTVQSIRMDRQGEGTIMSCLIPVKDPAPDQIEVDSPYGEQLNLRYIPALDQLRQWVVQKDLDLVISNQGPRHMSEFHRSVDWADVMESVGIPYLADLGTRQFDQSDPIWMRRVFHAALPLFHVLYSTLDKYRYHPFRVDLQR